MARDRRPWWARRDEGRKHHTNGYGEAPTGHANKRGGTARASGDHGTAPGVAESGNTITLEEWKRRQR